LCTFKVFFLDLLWFPWWCTNLVFLNLGSIF
jgi:hypothetical protein